MSNKIHKERLYHIKLQQREGYTIRARRRSDGLDVYRDMTHFKRMRGPGRDDGTSSETGGPHHFRALRQMTGDET